MDKLHDKEFVSPPKDLAADRQGVHDGNLSQHPDRIIASARPAGESDGLVDLEGIKDLYAEVAGVRSAYGEAYGLVKGEEGKFYVDRAPEVANGSGRLIEEDPEVVAKRKLGSWEDRVARGDFEPKWSNFTPLWRCTLE